MFLQICSTTYAEKSLEITVNRSICQKSKHSEAKHEMRSEFMERNNDTIIKLKINKNKVSTSSKIKRESKKQRKFNNNLLIHNRNIEKRTPTTIKKAKDKSRDKEGAKIKTMKLKQKKDNTKKFKSERNFFLNNPTGIGDNFHHFSSSNHNASLGNFSEAVLYVDDTKLPSFQEQNVGCQCWQTVDDSFFPEKECICQGNKISILPKTLAKDVQRL